MNKKLGWKKITGLVIAGLLIVYVAVALILIAVSNSANVEIGTVAEDASDWMSKLDDNQSLALVSIPGTHDTTTKYSPFHYSFQCQDSTVTEQLNAGYRFTDIRIKLATDKDGQQAMYMMHGFGHCRNEDNSFKTFQDFEADCIAFLKEHPTETIIVMIDAASNREKNASAVSEAVQAELANCSSYWYTSNEIPTIGQVRGKMILATRYGDVNDIGQDKCGWDLEWKSQNTRFIPDQAVVAYSLNERGDNFNVQNWFKVLPDVKWKMFKEGLDGNYTDEDTLLLNFLTISRGYFLLPCPRMRALELNEKLADYQMEAGKSYGIVILDFGTAALAQQIYETNFE